ncbi:MAG: flagellar hook-length control protein FliK, partial [Campylobacter sp.]|nr:flagellar hook-length control protein FliK [Campylobacter sp.]
MSKLAPQSEILKLTPSSKTQADKGNFKGAQGVEENESFLNALLASIEETNAFLPQNMKISKEEVAFEVMDKLKFSSFDEQDKISIFESASFMQILSLLDKLKIDTVEVKFSKLSSQLSELVKSEANFNALRGAKNIDELLQVAKNLGLEVRDIKVDRLLDLKATFPNLDRADFFKGAVDDVFKKVIENKIAHIEKELDKNLQGQNLSANLAGSQKNETPSLLSQTLQNLDSLTPKNPHKKEAKEERPKEPTPIRENLKENFKERQEGKNPSAAPNAAPKTIQEGRAQEASPVPKNAQSTFTQSVQTQEATQNFKEAKEERPKEPTPIRENL